MADLKKGWTKDEPRSCRQTEGQTDSNLGFSDTKEGRTGGGGGGGWRKL